MHILQKQLLELASRHNLGALKLREIAELLGDPELHPQKIKHHLMQLKKNGLMMVDKKKGIIERVKESNALSKFIAIPIVGAANCGEATILADEHIEGFLMLSKGMIKKQRGIYALRAVGSSMNKADIHGNSINDGDWVLVDSEKREASTGDYVVSIIDGTANIKKFVNDKENKQIVLMSESADEYPPIYIHPQDFDSYMIAGKVTQVVKRPKKAKRIG